MNSIIYLLLSVSIQAYSLCNPTKLPFNDKNLIIPLVPSATASFPVNNVSIPVVVGGFIQVVDGCTFKTVNFTMTTAVSAAWYGGNNNDKDGVRISESAVVPNVGQISTEYKFVTRAGAAVSFYDFNQFRLFETTSLSLLATADLPHQVTGSNNSPAPGSKPSNSSAFTQSMLYNVFVPLAFLL